MRNSGAATAGQQYAQQQHDQQCRPPVSAVSVWSTLQTGGSSKGMSASMVFKNRSPKAQHHQAVLRRMAHEYARRQRNDCKRARHRAGNKVGQHNE